MQDSHIDSPNRPRAEHRADPSPVQLSIVPYPGLVRPKLYRVWLWAFPKVIRDVVLCSLQGKCALERSWLRTRVSRNLQPRQQQLFQKQVAPPRRRAEARSARLWPFCTRSFSSRSEEHTSELQSRLHLVCRLLLEKKKKKKKQHAH